MPAVHVMCSFYAVRCLFLPWCANVLVVAPTGSMYNEARHRSTPIILVGGRGRLSSIRAAELDGEAHATLAQLLVLLEIPGELGAAINSNRVVAISCNECPTEQLRLKCGCVGNTGFNAASWQILQ